jgi:hypothetical protein
MQLQGRPLPRRQDQRRRLGVDAHVIPSRPPSSWQARAAASQSVHLPGSPACLKPRRVREDRPGSSAVLPPVVIRPERADVRVTAAIIAKEPAISSRSRCPLIWSVWFGGRNWDRTSDPSLVRRNWVRIAPGSKGWFARLNCGNYASRCPEMLQRVCMVVPASGSRRSGHG